MAFSKNSEFKYSIRGIDRIVEERGNQFIRFAQIAWAGADKVLSIIKNRPDFKSSIETNNDFVNLKDMIG